MAIDRRVFGLLFLYLLPVESIFKFEDCGAEDSILKLPAFSISPDPVHLKQRKLNISVHAEIIRDIPDSAKLEVKLYRIRKMFGMQLDIPIPCILGKYGSCTLPFCKYMDRFQSQVCPFFSANEMACECPPKAGNYSGENVQVQMAEIPHFGRLIAKGKYRTEIRMKEGDNENELSCFKFFTELL